MLRPLFGLALVAAPLALHAQRAADFNWSKTLASGSTVSIHNINGDIKVVPSTSGKVEILGYKRGDSRAADHLKVDVVESSRGINVCVVMDDSDASCDEDGMHSNSGRRWGGRDWNDAEMRLEVAVPANAVVRPSTVSGNIDLTGAHGDISASSVSGDVTLDRLHATSVRVTTVSGDIDVGVDELTGNGDFYFHSVSGDIQLNVPRTFGADLSMSTVSGDIDSDFPITLGNGRMSGRRVNARIGAGGRKLDVSTVSGDLKIRSAK
jgi:DUF4097 and DUF4098 domain-containing protein YvlB